MNISGDLDLAAVRQYSRRLLQGLLARRRKCGGTYALLDRVQEAISRLDLLLKQSGGAVEWRDRVIDSDSWERSQIATNPIFSTLASIIICDVVVCCLGHADFLSGTFDVLFTKIQCLAAYDTDIWLVLAACFLGHTAFVTEWLRNNFIATNRIYDAKEINKIAVFLLQISVKRGHLDLAREILNAGVDVNAEPFDDCQMPVRLAAQQGRPEMLQLLLDPTYRLRRHGDVYLWTTIEAAGCHNAAKATEMVQILLGATDQNLLQQSPRHGVFQNACRLGNLELAKMMLDGGPLEMFGHVYYVPCYESALWLAAENHHLDCVRLIVGNMGRFVLPERDGEYWKRVCFSRPFRLAVRNSDIDLLFALAPALEWRSSQKKVIAAAQVDGALERMYDMSGPLDFNSEKCMSWGDTHVTLGTYLLLQTVPNRALQNVTFLSQQREWHIDTSFLHDEKERVLHHLQYKAQYPPDVTLQLMREILH